MSEPTTPAGWGIELCKFWQQAGQALPVDVKLLAPEATKRFADPIGKIKAHDIAGIDGMLIKRPSKGDWCIAYDPAVESPGRINFTLGHELGHYFLHRRMRDHFQCGQGEMLDYESATSRKLEGEANKFASFLLMPIPDFKVQIANEEISLELLGHCANRYATSFTAKALKWIEFTQEAAVLVVAREGFICWSYPTDSARRLGLYLPHGTELPRVSLDNLAKVMDSRNHTTRVGAGVWHSTLEAQESIILSDRFDMAIFLVRFPFANLVEHEEEAIEDSVSWLSKKIRGW
ncbi:ImmA/IrrE family metallo-endopeptidase [Massilia sp. CCM 8733]|uniref:ImmA/IrrE family metallo-endopeptidase n=1 Tax=Massilia mucilaginosa TaxID=2609282 RepID=A0ABX0NVR2_9BURK|nr:ImmA/IrrE family metallo-endopeptidase [Massilia mucilaginosa]NHZ91038.1 ImmA/IrrE family metallo-endopeptidase [Massilia mucilaginosa]